MTKDEALAEVRRREQAQRDERAREPIPIPQAIEEWELPPPIIVPPAEDGDA